MKQEMIPKSRPGRRKKITGGVFLAILLVVITVHLLLPALILKVVNRELGKIPGYHAHIADIDISLLRGAYTLEGITFQNVETGDTVPVFSARHVDFSVEWSALFRGKVVGEIGLTQPRLTLFPSPSPSADTSSFTFSDLGETLRNLFPFTINRFAIRDGAIHFRDDAQTPPVDIRLDAIDAVARGLTNAQEGGGGSGASQRQEDVLPASFRLTARAMGHAPLVVNLAMAPLAETPTFDLDAELKTLDLTALNTFFRAYADVDVERGTFSVYTEIAAADGGFEGYVKPLTKDLKVLDLDSHEGGLLGTAWEALVAGVAQLLENPPAEQVGTKIPFRGTFSEPRTEIWSAVAYLLRNAFVRALQPGIENSIRLEGGPTLEEQESQEDEEAARS